MNREQGLRYQLSPGCSGSQHTWERRENFLWEHLKERKHYEDPDVDEEVILKCISVKYEDVD
jgi:hypothetical protein